VTTVDEAVESPAKRPNPFIRLYRGETSFDFVGRRWLWFTISGLIIVIGLISLSTRGLNLSIDFKGGTSWSVIAPGATVSGVTSAVEGAGLNNPTVEILGGRTVQVEADLTKESQADQTATKAKVLAVMQNIANTHSPAGEHQVVSVQDVGATWGSQITHKAVEALIIFFFVVVIYISIRFEWKMAIAALIAVIHDLLVTAGIYSITGLQVTPDTVIAILTILGYSLYDTVVVFDRVADNTKGLGTSGRMTYEEVVNLSMNQTLARSINTSLVAILPVLSVLVIGAYVLGATTLQYFGFALVIGLLSGAYSSIFIASPLLSIMKEREPRYRTLRQKLESRADRTGLLTPKAAALMTAAASSSAAVRAQKRASAPSKSQLAKVQARSKGAKPRPAPSSAGVLRPGSAGAGTGAGKGQQTAVSPDEVDLDGDEVALNGEAADGRVAVGRQQGNGAVARPRKSTGAKRPPARRKGGKKGGRRR